MSRFSYLTDILSRFRKDQSGIVALEFVLILPVMILLLFTSWEVSTIYLVKKRTDHAATVLADLTTQSNAMTNAAFNGITEAIEAVMFPYEDRPMRLHVLAVEVDANRRVQLAWQRTTGGGAGLTVNDLPANLRLPNSFYIMTAARVIYRPSFATNLVNDITLQDQAIMVPRLTSSINNTN
jgi:Flp pilus assembly protein TadG